MRKYIVYIMTMVFLLFSVVNKYHLLNLLTSQENVVSHSINKNLHHSSHTSEKLVTSKISESQNSFSIDDIQEDDLLGDDVFSLLLATAFFGFVLLLHNRLQSINKKTYQNLYGFPFSVRKFILIRSIRI